MCPDPCPPNFGQRAPLMLNLNVAYGGRALCGRDEVVLDNPVSESGLIDHISVHSMRVSMWVVSIADTDRMALHH